MNYEPTKTDAAEAEILSADERRLSALLSELKRVEAPKDFDFKLKAKIAAAESSSAGQRKTSFFPALRYVFPLFVVVLLSAFAALKIFAPDDAPVPSIVAENPQPSNKSEIAAANVAEIPVTTDAAKSVIDSAAVAAPAVSADSMKASNKTAQVLAVVKAPEKSVSKQQTKSRNVGQGSYDIGARATKTINQNPNAVSTDKVGQGSAINVLEALSQLGIEVEFIGADCKVKSVREGTAARIANFQPGDLIEAIDDKKLSSDTSFSQSFKGKVFRVVRAGKQMVIDLTKR